jgi:putative ABC transport system permease protein
MRSVAAGTKDPSLVITTRIGEANIDLQTLRTELLRSPQIRAVTAADELPWEGGGGWHFLVTRNTEAAAKPIEVSANRVWYDFFDTLDMKLLAGRAFSQQFADEIDIPAIIKGRAQPLSVIVDRDLAARLGWNNPEEAIGKLIFRPSPGVGAAQLTLQIVGVVERGYPRLTGSGAETNLFVLMPALVNYPIVRLAPQNVQGALAHMDATWKTLAPQAPLELRFVDELFAQTFSTFAAVGSAAAGLAGVAFIISLMGLFAVAIYTTTERLREIGVRKTLGATPRRIFQMLLLDFSKPIVVANLLAWPFAYFAAQAYLSLFVQRAEVSVVPFVLSLLITLLIAWITIAGQALRAARMQPATILRMQ